MAGAGAPAAPAQPLPPLFEFGAPAGWKAIDFISDLHLSPALPRTFDAWAKHLQRTSADAVFILGDLFEAWIGDDARTLPFERSCVDVLAEAASQRHLAFMAGNRDFLVGSTMLRECGMTALPDPTVLDAWGQRVLLAHGDALCLADAEYQAFRQMVRDTRWQREFLTRPLAERVGVAAEMRRRSDTQRRFDGRDDVDIDPATAVAWMHAMGTPELLHGHTHRPGSDLLAPGYKRHVLSDWDLDDTHRPRAEVMRLRRGGFERLPVHAA